MDHVPDNSHDVGGGQHQSQLNGYSQDDLGFVDPSLVDEAAWPVHQSQYQQADLYAAPQNYQQYGNTNTNPLSARPSYSDYGIPQTSHYDPNPYSDLFGGQFHTADHRGSYGLGQYDGGPYAAAPSVQSPYYPQDAHLAYTSATNSATISPSALAIDDGIQTQANNNISNVFQSTTSNRGYGDQTNQNWGGNPITTYSTSFSDPQNNSVVQPAKSTPDVVFPQLSSTAPTPSPRLAQTPSNETTSSRAPTRQVTSTALSQQPSSQQPTSLRITHPDLVAKAAQTNSTHGLRHAPFVSVSDTPVEIDIVGTADIPTFRPRKNKSGRDIVPGLDLSHLLNQPHSSSSSKSRSASSKISKRGRPRKDVEVKLATPTGSFATPTGSFVPPTGSSALSPASVSSEEEFSESETDSSSDDSDRIPPEKMSEVRSLNRPFDPVEAAAWDVIGIIWLDRNRNVSQDELVTAIPKFLEYITNVRNEIKKVSAELTAAKEGKKQDDIVHLTAARDMKRASLAKALEAAIDKGHPQIVKRLAMGGGKIVVILANTLIECIKTKDFTGELPRAVLKLATKFVDLTDDLLEKNKLAPAMKKLVASATGTAKAEIQALVDKIKASTPEGQEREKKAKQEAVNAEKIANGLALQERMRARKAEEAARSLSGSGGVKRGYDGDGSNGKPAKKTMSESASMTNKLAGGVKPVSVATKPANFAMGLSRPGTKSQSAAIKPVAAAIPAKKPEQKPVATSSQSSFADLLASINEPKRAPTPPPVAKLIETAEQKVKRERKESRRHLRVRWREGGALEEIRLFRHEQAEDEGRQANMLKDAHDDRSEGMRLKQAMRDDNVEDEEEVYGEIDIQPSYAELIPIDFDTLPEDVRSKNFTTRGGKANIESGQKIVQEQREARELMVIYSDPKDIPYSPKEPPQNSDDSYVPEDGYFGEPQDALLLQRLDQINQFGPVQAQKIFIQRAEERHFHNIAEEARSYNPMLTKPITYGTPENPMRLARDPIIQKKADPEYAGKVLANLEMMCKSLMGKQFPAIEPPSWMIAEKDRKIWWEGYNRDYAARLTRGEKEEEAAAQKARQIQVQAAPQMIVPVMSTPHMFAPSMTSQPVPFNVPGFQPPQPPLAVPIVATDPNAGYDMGKFQSILASLNNGGLNVGAVQQPQQPVWNAQWGTTAEAYLNNQQHAGQDHSLQDSRRNGNNHNNRNKQDTRDYENGYDGARERFREKDKRGGGDPKKYMYKKEPCSFFAAGKCIKGAKCTYLHDNE